MPILKIEIDKKQLKRMLEVKSDNICIGIDNSDGWYIEPNKFHELSVFEKRLIKSVVRHVVENVMYDWIKENMKG